MARPPNPGRPTVVGAGITASSLPPQPGPSEAELLPPGESRTHEGRITGSVTRPRRFLDQSRPSEEVSRRCDARTASSV